MTRERITLIERRLRAAILGRDGVTATALQRELAQAHNSTTELSFAEFRTALATRTLRTAAPRSFTVCATAQEMADLAKQLHPQPRKAAVDRGYQQRMQQMVRKYPYLADDALIDAVSDAVADVLVRRS